MKGKLKMSEEEKEDLKEATNWLSALDINSEWEASNKETILSTIDKLQKVIDLMAELLCGIDVMNELGKDSWNWNKEQMKEYFYKKAEE